ncbi:MAG: alpha-amylase family glycosyl hydrolase [Pleurocapsa sp.]
MTGATKVRDYFTLRIEPILTQIYDRSTSKILLDRLLTLLQDYLADTQIEPGNQWTDLSKWDQRDVLLITYGDSLSASAGKTPLATLESFLAENLQDIVSGVHILPFFPYSSDDGFSVIDYKEVNPKLGTWEDVQAISQNFDLMFDLVINHVSSQSSWFKQFQEGIKPGCDYFIEVDPETDLSGVVRPRSSPLLAKVKTVNGEKYVWATFSHDQIDLNFANPDVLVEIIEVILFYVEKGAKYIRLDAVGYLWKKLNTPCIHLNETHAVIKLLRELLQIIGADVAIITETNVPNRENLSYFGNRNEAHLIYNFSLPPLLLNALVTGKSKHLKHWMMSMPPAPLGCAYFNFTASHDGIGLRPVEGILSEEESSLLVKTMKKFGGKISNRMRDDGKEHPYEINISLFDACKGTVKGEDQWQIERFICSQTIMMSLESIPAFYIHSLLATPNNHENVSRTGSNRAINRHKWDYEKLRSSLKDPQSPQSIIFNELRRLLKIRRRQAAFHPNATQYTLHLGKGIFAFWRQSLTRDQSIFSIHNISDRVKKIHLSDLNLVNTDPWCDLISGHQIEDIYAKFPLQPYHSAWITNKF